MKRPRRNTTVTCLILAASATAVAFPGGAEAQDPNGSSRTIEGRSFADAYSERVANAFEAFGFAPELDVVLVRAGEEPAVYRFGVSAQGEPKVFGLASVTKGFTGLTAALLEAEGNIDLDTPLAEALPDVQFSAAVRPQDVKLRDLLTHSHGLKNPGVQHRYLFSGLTDRESVMDALAYTVANEDAPLGTYAYSNFGYILFGLYLEGVTGRDWRDVVAETALRAGMTTFTLRPSEVPEMQAAEPYYGALEGGAEAIAYRRLDSNATPSGGGMASAEDMGRWISMWLSPSEHGLPPMATESALSVQFARESGSERSHFEGYGLGWFVGEYRGRAYAQHAGGFFGTSAYIALLPDDGFGVFAVSNEYPLAPALVGFAGRTAMDMFLGITSDELDLPDAPARMAQGGVSYFTGARAEVYGQAWNLSLAPRAYAGVYEDSSYGTMTIEVTEDGTWFARIGELETQLFPGPSADTAGGDLVPYNDEAYAFVVDDGDVVSLEFRAGRFRKIH